MDAATYIDPRFEKALAELEEIVERNPHLRFPKATALSPAEKALAAIEAKAHSDQPKWRNQEVVRSEQGNSGYRYNDWRNW